LDVLLTTLFDLTIPISILPIVSALAVSAGVGIFFVHYPARRAARLDLVQAQRFDQLKC
jgi:ABC-type antimicrobial peptide transport system permease subunit